MTRNATPRLPRPPFVLLVEAVPGDHDTGCDPRLPRDPFVLLVEAVPGDCTDATAAHCARQRVGEADEWDWRSTLGRRGRPPLL